MSSPNNTVLTAESSEVQSSSSWGSVSETANSPLQFIHQTPLPQTAGVFQVVNGKIVSPGGASFIAKGINVPDWAAVGPSGNPGNGTNNGAALLQSFPGINMVRLNCQNTTPNVASDQAARNYNNSPAAFDAFIANMTKAGVVTAIEDHSLPFAGSGSNLPTGSAAAAQLKWYADMATHYKSNPYVWFETSNEPNDTNTPKNIANNQANIYQAIRGTGNQNPILLCTRGGYNTDYAVANPSAFAAMKNVIWDEHYYGWLSNFSTNQSTVGQYLTALATGGSASLTNPVRGTTTFQGAGQVRSADGVMPVIIGEYGTSTTGSLIDANGTQVVTAVEHAGFGSVAWNWSSGSADILTRNGALTAYGTETAKYFTGHPSTSWTDFDKS